MIKITHRWLVILTAIPLAILSFALYSVIFPLYYNYHHKIQEYVLIQGVLYHTTSYSCIKGTAISIKPKAVLTDINTHKPVKCETVTHTKSEYVKFKEDDIKNILITRVKSSQ